ncbi:MAG: amidase [Fervidobacterium sp.]
MFIYEAQKLSREKKITPSILLKESIDKIEEWKRLGAFITTNIDQVLELAAKQDKILELEYDKLPTLFGIPLALKDNIYTKNLQTTAGSLFWKDFVPTQDAQVVTKLKNSGALLVGKTNMHEIALGVTSNNPHYGPCLNPHDNSRVAGGSSGGSAIAVATGMALGALGTDTGGSIRIPASLCGVVGFKPSYGTVSTRGIIPLSWHLDHVGPIATCVEDVKIIFNIIAGYDSKDPFSVKNANKKSKSIEKNQIRIAKAVGNFINEADANVLKMFDNAVKMLRESDLSVEEENVDWLRELSIANRTITQVEAATFHKERLATHPDWFGEDVRERLLQGSNASGIDYATARYNQTVGKYRFKEFFKKYDVLLLPTVPVIAPPIAGRDAVEMAKVLTKFTAPFNLTGLPAITLPCGKVDGLPVGLQIVGGYMKDKKLLSIAQMIETILKY